MLGLAAAHSGYAKNKSACEIITIASFPKSGVTYLSSLLYYSIFYPVDKSDRYEHVERDIIVDVHVFPNATPNNAQGKAFVKSHSSFNIEDRWCRLSTKAIFLTRDPIDVANSSYDYFKLTNVRTLARDEFLTQWIKTGGRGHYVSGTWTEHFISWKKQISVPMLTVNYEDLVKDPLRELRKILVFAGLSASEAALAYAVERSSMKAMRIKEEDEFRRKTVGIFYRPDLESSMSAGARFINKGYRNTRRQLTLAQRVAAFRKFDLLKFAYR